MLDTQLFVPDDHLAAAPDTAEPKPSCGHLSQTDPNSIYGMYFTFSVKNIPISVEYWAHNSIYAWHQFCCFQFHLILYHSGDERLDTGSPCAFRVFRPCLCSLRLLLFSTYAAIPPPPFLPADICDYRRTVECLPGGP